MKNFLILLLLAFLILIGASCNKESESQPQDLVSLANPASVYCEEHGGNLELRSNESGQYGVCIFSDGSECEEWAYLRGECLPARASQWQAGLPARVSQLSADQRLSDEENSKAMQKSRELAETWIKNNAPTYLFDGSDLRYLESRRLDCVDCYEHVFFFKSSQTSFGDRSGQILAQVVTPHEIVVTIEGKNIVSVITDNGFDEMTEEILAQTDEIKQFKVSLVPRNDFLGSGTAILREELGKVKVIINIVNYEEGIQPASIHKGSCDDLEKVLYSLNSLEGGKTETLLNISLAELRKQLPLAINIYKDISSSAICGDIIF